MKSIYSLSLFLVTAALISSCAPTTRLAWNTHVSAENQYKPVQRIWERPFMPWMPVDELGQIQAPSNKEGLPVDESEVAPPKEKVTKKVQKKPQVKANTTKPKNVTTKPKVTSYPTPAKVPGKPGFVFSPYNNRVVDVTGLPSGTLVNDPQFPKEQKKFFRVP